MRRRIDIPSMPFLQPDGNFYYITEDGELILHVQNSPGEEEGGQELVSMGKLPASYAQDYVSRARYLVGKQSPDTEDAGISALDARRAIAKLERATAELREGISSASNFNISAV